MKRSRLLLASALAVVGTAVPAGDAVVGAGTPKPVPGAWKVVDLFEITAGGGFTVTRTGRVRGIRVNPASGASTGCGTDAITVKGTFRLRRTTRGGFTSWIVGRSAPATSDGVKTIPATITRAGKSEPGRIKLVFAYDSRRKGGGELSYEGCTLEFNTRKG